MLTSASSPSTTCDRCRATVRADQTEFRADGVLCRDCVTSTMIGGTDATQLERDLARSTARRQVVVGVVCLVLAVGLFAVSASGGSIVLVPTGLTAFAILELGRGIAGFGRLAAR